MGTEALWVPLAIAAVSGGAQYANQTAANSRSDKAEAAAIANQQQIRQKGTADVQKTVNDITKSNPNDIASQESGNFVNQLRRNAAGSTTGASTTSNPQTFGGSVSSLAPVAGGSSRYNSQKAGAQAEVQSYGGAQGSELADLDAAVRQRQNEGIEMANTETQLTGLGAQSYAQNFVDQLRAQTAGRTNPWVSLFSTLAGNAAGAASKNPNLFGGGTNIPGWLGAGTGGTPGAGDPSAYAGGLS